MNLRIDLESILVFSSASILVVLAITGVVMEQHKWEKFKVEHNCVVIEKVKASTSYGYTSKGGSVHIDNPSKTAYKCNDGVVYWR